MVRRQCHLGVWDPLGPSHSVAKNTKYENFMAMLDEFVKLRDNW